jgi:CubicO group peptidase (beta-lactamase class C family)
MDLQAEVERLVAAHKVPGAVAGCWRDGRLTTAAAGVANLNTGAAMTPDTAFLTGSITKVWTTTLIMGLADEGALDLDVPIVEYAPDVHFGADPAVAKTLTLRHLVNHSSGIDSADHFVATRGYPEGVDDYLEPIRHAGKLSEPGVVSSYNNIGWIVAEIVLRRLTGKNFHELLRERVIEPLGLNRSVLTANEAILNRTAIGHFPDGRGGNEPTPQFLYPDAWAAPGATLITTVEDTITFLRTHLGGGTSPDGARVIGPESARAMQTPTTPEPSGPETGFGLGWRYLERDGKRVLYHAGGSIGGVAHALISPADDLAVISFVNSSAGLGVHADLLGLLFEEGPSPLAPPAAQARTDVDLTPFAGRYRRKGAVLDVVPAGDEVLVRFTPVPEEKAGALVAATSVVSELRAVATGPASLVTVQASSEGLPVPLTFTEPGPDGYGLVFMWGRLARRIG